MASFLKKYLVLILCGVLVLGALGVGVWYLVTPPADNADQSQETGDSTGDFNDNLDIDIGFGEMNGDGGVGNLPSGGNDDETTNNAGSGNQSSGNQSSGNQSSGNQASGGENNTPNGGNSNNNTGTGTGNDSETVDMTGSVVPNPFN